MSTPGPVPAPSATDSPTDFSALNIDELIKVADTLIDAMPFIRAFRGKTIVIKYGGAAMLRPELKQGVIEDIVLMHDVGIRPIIVHGGGPEINDLLKRLQLESKFVDGQRVTTAETLEVVEMVLAGKVNSEIVNLLNQHGAKAVGMSGKDARLVVAEKLENIGADGKIGGDLGFVGNVKQVNPEVLDVLRNNGIIPVIAPIGVDENGQGYNINADTVALGIARAVKASKLIYLSDTAGLLRDPKDPASVISTIYDDEIEPMIASKVISGGMIPKARGAADALKDCEKVHLLDGRLPHSLLLELFTKRGIGTQFLRRGKA